MAGSRGPQVSFIRKHRSFFAGVFLLIPAVVIPVLLMYTLMKAEFMQGWCHLCVTGDNAYGLTKGSPVMVSGMTIGYVEKIELVREGEIGIRFKVSRSYQNLVKKDTQARFQQKSPVVGEWVIGLTGGSEDAAIVEDDDTLQAVLPMRFDKTIQQVTSIVASISSVVDGIAQGRGTAGELLTGDTISGMVRGLGTDLSGLIGTVGATLQNVDTLINELTALSQNGNSMIDSFSFAAAEVQTILGNVTTILENVESASDEVEPLLDQVRHEIDEADRMMRTLQRSWIYRKMDGKHDDPLLKGNP